MYYPIWRTTKYTSTADTMTYRIVYGEDQVVYTGKAYKMPDENRIEINLNGTCRNYLNSLIYTYLSAMTVVDEVVCPMSSSGDFHLDVQSGSNWNTVYSWGFVNDWTYNKSVSAITGSRPLSEPINGHASADMLIPYTHFTENPLSICYNVLPAVDWVGSLSPESMDVPPAASSYTAVFSSNLPWTATTYNSAGENQFTMSPMTGLAGDTVLTYTFEQNEDTDTVYCSLMFEAYDRTGAGELDYELWQDGCEIDGEFDNYSSAITVPYNTTSVTFNVLANCEWEVGYTGDITPTPWSGDGNGSVTISFPANTGTARSFSFYIQSWPNGLVTSRNFVINQGGAPDNKKVYYTTTDNGIVSLNVTGSTYWGANILSNTYVGGRGVIEFDGPISRIAYESFSGSTTLESIIIPDIVAISPSAFKNCTALSSVTIYGVEGGIQTDAFSGCTSLKAIELPSNLKYISTGAFRYCGLTAITIPDSVETVDENAFLHCSDLETVIIGSGVTTLVNSSAMKFSGWTFTNCSKLSEIYSYP